ncbi:MAG: methyltransferase [Thermotogaceae bacterium]|nr:methyltransferase [Thermotogaceae bacterium]
MSFTDVLKLVKLCCFEDRVTHATALLLLNSKPRRGAARVLELGSGNGAVSIGMAKLYGVDVVGIDVQKDLIEAAKKSAVMNSVEDKVMFVNADVRDVKTIISAESYDMVISNPPHHFKKAVSDKRHRAIERSLNEDLMDSFVNAIKWTLKNGGDYVLVLSPENLIEWIWKLRNAKLEPKKMIFFHPKREKDAELVVVRGRKNGKVGLVVKFPVLEE